MNKRSFILWILMVLISAPVLAEDLGEDQHWAEQVGGSITFPVNQSAAQVWGTGFGGDLSIGYRLDPHFSLGIGTGYHQFGLNHPPSGLNGHFAYVPLQAIARYTFSAGDLRPYFLLSAGAGINIATGTLSGVTYTQTETDFLLSPGLGAAWIVSPKAAIFLQAKLDMDFFSQKFNNGAITLFVPIDAGLVFYLL